MQITVSNRRWNLRFVRTKAYDGECDPPTTVGKEIRVADNLRGERKLEVVIHEALHAASWNHAEEWVTETASDIARILTRLGYTDGT